jgi:hypothetical protein
MTALTPSDQKRFRDASEAEQALREAWDRCLTQGLVHPAVLAMEETAHDKVPARMHEPRNLPPKVPSSGGQRVQPVIPLSHDTGEQTAIDDNMLAKQQQLMVESTKRRVGDDDPTILQLRDDKPRPGTAPGLGAPAKSGTVKIKKPATRKVDGTATLEEEIVTDTRSAEAPPGPKTASTKGARRSNAVLYVLIVLLVAAATGFGLYYGGVIKL